METTYTMIGGDGQQYGPITLAQIKTWILEGRIGTETQVLRSDTNTWLPAGRYPELGLGAPQPPVSYMTPPTPPVPGVIRAPAVSGVDPMLERRSRSGARWYFWIAGLSLINIFSANSAHGMVSAVGLSVTLFIQGFAENMGTGGPGLGMALSLAAAGLFAMFGFFAMKRQSWSFIAGMVFYALDTVLAVIAAALSGFWLVAVFHIFVMVWLFLGWRANEQLKRQAG